MRASLSISIDISWKQLKALRPLWSDDTCRHVFKLIAKEVATMTEQYATDALASAVSGYTDEEGDA